MQKKYTLKTGVDWRLDPDWSMIAGPNPGRIDYAYNMRVYSSYIYAQMCT